MIGQRVKVAFIIEQVGVLAFRDMSGEASLISFQLDGKVSFVVVFRFDFKDADFEKTL